jgi:hypothetical protein
MSVATTRLVRGVKDGARVHLDGPGTVIYQRRNRKSKLIIEAPATTKVTHLEPEPPPADFLEKFRRLGGQ